MNFCPTHLILLGNLIIPTLREGPGFYTREEFEQGVEPTWSHDVWRKVLLRRGVPYPEAVLKQFKEKNR